MLLSSASHPTPSSIRDTWTSFSAPAGAGLLAARRAMACAGPQQEGQLISHEHTSSRSVKILELPDGSRILRFESLDTSDGPDLRVWLTRAPVIEGVAGWYVFDDGVHLDLGALKANKGDQNYEIPAAAVLGDFSSVSIWCARFAVSFAAAELNASAPIFPRRLTETL
ncbi:MAG: hypothetical protein JWQ56_3382 [Pseudarthrobacter sp.]|nr:hypothetical protein [Pseudarthrobacter sp.]